MKREAIFSDKDETESHSSDNVWTTQAGSTSVARQSQQILVKNSKMICFLGSRTPSRYTAPFSSALPHCMLGASRVRQPPLLAVRLANSQRHRRRRRWRRRRRHLSLAPWISGRRFQSSGSPRPSLQVNVTVSFKKSKG